MRSLLLLVLTFANAACGGTSVEQGVPLTVEGNTYYLGNAVVTQDLDQGLRIMTIMTVDDTCAGVADDVFAPLAPGDELVIVQEARLPVQGRNDLPAVDAKVTVVLDRGSALLRTYFSGLGTPGDFVEVTPISIEGEQIDLRLTFHSKLVGQTTTLLSEPGILEASFFAEYCPPLVPP